MSRKPSRKPLPRPGPTVVTATKTTAATGQLESAIQLWFGYGDPVSILVLASNAEDCLHAIGSKIGIPSGYQIWLQSQPKDVRERAKYIQDFAKHGFKDLDEEASFSVRVAEVLMYFAGRCYRKIFGAPTVLMLAFEVRYAMENPALVVPRAEQLVATLREIKNPADITRQEFLEENFAILERVLARVHPETPPE